MTKKIIIDSNTTLYPVPVVLVTCGDGEHTNVLTLNRISSCNADPPMLAISVRYARASHALIKSLGEFVVNLPDPQIELVTDFVGSTTAKDINKWEETGLKQNDASFVQPPLLDICPVNIECRVIDSIDLPSHTLFIGKVLAIHADEKILNASSEIDYDIVAGGFSYRSATVRERPIENFKPEEQRNAVNAWRDQNAGI